jgi:hypothetical protein
MWREEVGFGLRRLEENQSIDLAGLQSNELFITVLIQASQVVVRNHQLEKITALRNAVYNSALGIDIKDDLQLLFIRYIDELTPSHFVLLKFFCDESEQSAEVESYEELFKEFDKKITHNLDRDEFKLLCEDLTGRYLLRISSKVEDFDGLYESTLLQIGSRQGPMVTVSEPGKKLIEFITESDFYE